MSGAYAYRPQYTQNTIGPEGDGMGPIKRVDKVWGYEEWWVNEPEYCFKRLVLNPGYTCSYHYHQQKKETFIVWEGHCSLQVGEETHELSTGQQITIAGQPHRFYLEAGATEPCVIYEVSTHHDDADVVRLTESGKEQ